MRQDVPFVTAPTNPAPKWPEGYLAVLRAAGAQEKAIPDCIGWVQRFFAKHPGRSDHELGRREIERFLSEIAAHPRISNWQVQQARNCFELYYERFRGIALSPRGAIPADVVVVAHSSSKPVLRNPSPAVFARKDNSDVKKVYTRPQENVNSGF